MTWWIVLLIWWIVSMAVEVSILEFGDIESVPLWVGWTALLPATATFVLAAVLMAIYEEFRHKP